MPLSSNIKKDDWLSTILGIACYNLDALAYVKAGDTPNELEIPFLAQAKANCDDMETVLYLQNQGFQVIDTNVTFALNLEQAQAYTTTPPYKIVLAEPQHEKQVHDCAEKSFIYTRYHLDPKVSVSHANQIKAEWASNFFKGQRGQKMTLAMHEDQVVGFCQILEPNPLTRVIDLIAVDENHRRKGLAQAMIMHALNGEEKIIVGTQVSNIPSIRCYESMGFQLIKSQYVLHHHQ